MGQLDLGNQFLEIDGYVVERDALRVAEELKRINPDLEILCLNPDVTTFTEAPYVVCELCPDGKYRRIFEAWQLDNTIVDRVLAADRFSGNDLLAQMDAHNAAIQNEKRRRYTDLKTAKLDIVEKVVRTRQSKYSYEDPGSGDLVTIYDDRPSKREAKDKD